MTLMRTVSTAATAAALTLLVGCGSMGGLGGILGGSDPNSGYPSSSSQSQRIQGTVNNVDTRNQRIDISVYSNNSNRQQNATIYYDNRTRVSYRNQNGNPSQLERGDQVDITVYNNGNNQALADTITVTQSVSDNNNGYPNNNNYPNTYPNTPNNNYPNSYPSNGQASDVQGTVSRVDTNNQRIDMNVSYINGLRNSQSNYTIYYDSRTRVLYQNQTHAPSDLEQGDQIEVRLNNNGGNGRAIADTITVTRNVRQ